MWCISCGRTTTTVEPESALAFCSETHFRFYTREVWGQVDDRPTICDMLESRLQHFLSHLESADRTKQSAQEFYAQLVQLIHQIQFRYDPVQLTLQLIQALRQYPETLHATQAYAAAFSVTQYVQRMARLAQSFVQVPALYYAAMGQDAVVPTQLHVPGQKMLKLLWPDLHLLETGLFSTLSLQFLLYVLYALDKSSRVFHNTLHQLFGMILPSSMLVAPQQQTATLARHMTALQQQLAAPREMEEEGIPLLLLHTALFLRSDLMLGKETKEQLHRQIGLEVFQYESKKPQHLAQMVNLWCQQTTDGHIQQLLDPVTQRNDVAVMLINTLHFDAQWETPFEPALTATRRFISHDGTESNVTQMHNPLVHAYYWETSTCQYLQLRYKRLREQDDLYALFIALPRTMDEETVVFTNFIKKLPLFKQATVNLYLPRWQQHSKLDLNMLFRARRLDEGTMTLYGSRTLEKAEMKLTRVMQQVAFAVDELGTVASVATVGEMQELSRPPQPYDVLFDANHTFHYSLMNVSRQVSLVDGVYDGL